VRNGAVRGIDSSFTAATLLSLLISLIVSLFLPQLHKLLPPIFVVIGMVIAVGILSGVVTKRLLAGGVAAALGFFISQVMVIYLFGMDQIMIVNPIITFLRIHIVNMLMLIAFTFLAGALFGQLFKGRKEGPREEITRATIPSSLEEEKWEEAEITEAEAGEEIAFRPCKFCSEKIPVEAIFCPFCGRKLVEKEITETQT